MLLIKSLQKELHITFTKQLNTYLQLNAYLIQQILLETYIVV